MPAETIYVKNDTSVCVGSAPAGDPGSGSVTKPLCTMDTVSTLLSPDRSLVLVRGTVQGATSWILNGKGYDKQSDVSLSVVGQSVPHIAGGASAALNMSAGTAYVRGLELSSGGTGAAVGFTGGILQLDAVTVDRSADGVDISGGSLSIKSSTISGGSAIGIKATGGSLNVDKSYVESNMTGGILINGATYTIQNTVLAANGGTTTGYGIEVDMAPSGSQFWFNTVVNNPVAATCASTNPPSLGESIVIGPVVNCVVSDSVTTSPSFASGRPYHLTAHLACPAVPTSSPDHDIDGDPRSAPLDCGADQFVQ